MTLYTPKDDAAFLAGATARAMDIKKREVFEESLYEFLKVGWRYIDPAPFVGGWHLEAIAEHLEAVTYGHIKRLLINCPPRCSKSSLVTVAWPAWAWAHGVHGSLDGPETQFLFASYSERLSLRDSIKTRRLIDSPWYQKLWGRRYKLTSDQNTKIRFDNSEGGYRIATSVGGTLTGEGAGVCAIDDAHKADEVESDLVRRGVIDWWDEVFTTRLNDPRLGAFVVIGHRVHSDDLSNHLLDQGNFTHLMLPMEYEPSRHCVTVLGLDVEGKEFEWEDPRYEEGELLCEGRYGAKEIVDHKTRPYVWAGQFQQRPTPKGGGILKEEFWRLWEEKTYPKCQYILASLDTAFTEKEENCASALSIWGSFKDENGNPRMICIYAWEKRLEFNDLIQQVIDTCTVDKRQTTSFGESTTTHRFPVDRLLIEAKANGISVAQEIHRLVGFTGAFGMDMINPGRYGDKTARVHSIQHLLADGLVWIPFVKPHGYEWANKVIDQCASFRPGKKTGTDLVDTVSMALRYLRDSGFALTRDEHTFEVAEESRYRERLVPLYPA